MRALATCACVAVALGCKSRDQLAVEAYERAACACFHHDLACARAARSAWVDAPHHAARWYERTSWEELRELQDAGDECFERAVHCSESDACDVDQLCVPSSPKTPTREVCVRVAKEGEPCNGHQGDVCARGLECWTDDPLAEQGGVCDDPWCPPPPGGICVKPPTKEK